MNETIILMYALQLSQHPLPARFQRRKDGKIKANKQSTLILLQQIFSHIFMNSFTVFSNKSPPSLTGRKSFGSCKIKFVSEN